MSGAGQRPASSDSPSTSASSLSPLLARLTAIEEARRGAGLSIERLAGAANLSVSWYRVLLRDPSRAAPAVIERLARALKGLPPSPADAQAALVRATYDAFLAYLCLARGQPIAPTREAVPAQDGATRRERELIRQAARYLVNTHLGLSCAAIGRALGVSKVAVHLSLKTIEDLRDDPAWNRVLGEAEGSIRNGL